MKKENRSLIYDLKDMLYNIPGSPEREHIATLLNESVRFKMDANLTRAIATTIDKSTYTIEHNLDFLDVPFESTWVEWDEKDRHINGYIVEDDKNYPDKIGVLLAKNPSHQDGIIGFVAWKTGDKVDHSQAILSWNLSSFEGFSLQARKLFSKEKNEVFARIMSLINTSVPDGFIEEMKVLYDVSDGHEKNLQDFYNDAHKNASAETLFIITFLLMLQTKQTKIIKQDLGDEEFIYECRLENNSPRKFFSKPKGFVRKNSMKGATLEWHPS